MSTAWLAGGDGAVTGLAVALGCGLMIGLERERRKQHRKDASERDAAGIRSFAIAALAGALAQLLDEPALVALGAAAVGALAAIAYFASRRATLGRADADPGLTTEVALFVTYLLGALAMREPALAAGVAAVLAGLLAARERLHRFATQLLTEAELHDGLMLAALALVLLPLLPAAPQPWLAGLPPRQLMWLLTLILLLQAAGHVALRIVGARTGLAMAGFFSGFVSSTATIAAMGARAHRAPQERAACEAGAIGSSGATWTLSLLMLLATVPQAARGFVLPAATALAVTATAGWLAWRRAGRHASRDARSTGDGGAALTGGQGPLRVREAAIAALVLSSVAVAVAVAQRQFGSAGLWAGTLLAAAADAQAPVTALAALYASGQVTPEQVRDGALLAIATNTATRSAVAFASGGRAYLSGPGRDFARRWREAAFIPVITPSIVQLKTALARHRPVQA